MDSLGALVRRAAWPVVIALASSHLTHAQSSKGPAGTVSGVAYDSVGRAFLVGATVQLAPLADMTVLKATATTDSLGRFNVTGVAAGRYAITFWHPVLDSLGVDAPVREVDILDGHTAHIEIGVPSPARIRAAVCGPTAALDSSNVVLGMLRDAHTLGPARAGAVTAEWVGLRVAAHHFERHLSHVSARVGATGRFALCGVPAQATINLVATSGSDSTRTVEMDVPIASVMHRDLFIERPAAIASKATTATLHGVVVRSDGQPVAGAQVKLEGGPEATTNSQGEWALSGARAGTQMIDIRAVGFYPSRQVVDVVDGAPIVRASLSTVAAILDTVRISAEHFSRLDPNGFYARRHNPLGRFFDSAQVAARFPGVTSDFLQTIPELDVRVVQTGSTVTKTLTMRTMGTTAWAAVDARVRAARTPGSSAAAVNSSAATVMGGVGYCLPALYLNGMRMSSIKLGGAPVNPNQLLDASVPTADDIDRWITPSEIMGIEIYESESETPLQYRIPGCGAILMWTH